MKKIFALCLAMLLVAGVFAACGSQSTKSPQVTVTESGKSVVSVTMMNSAYPQRKWDGSPLQELVREKFGLDIKMDLVDPESYGEKYPVIIATGSMPEIMAVNEDWYGLQANGDRGMFLKLNDKMDKMPNLKKKLDDLGIEFTMSLSEQGNNYVLPHYNETKSFWNAMIVRGDILDSAGIDKKSIDSMDALYDMFIDLRDFTGIKGFYGTSAGLNACSSMAYAWNGISSGTRYWDFDSERWVDGYTSQAYKDYVTFFANLYKDEVINRDFLSMPRDEWGAEVHAGNIFAWGGSFSTIDRFNNEMQPNDPSVYWTWIKMPPYNGKYGKWESAVQITSWSSFVISSKVSAEQTDAILAFFDWLYTDEGKIAVSFGIEGESYVMQDGIPHWLREQDKITVSDSLASQYTWQNEEQWEATTNRLPLDLGFINTLNNPAWVLFDKHMAPYGSVSTYEKIYEDIIDVFAGPYPPKPFTQDESDEAAVLKSTIETFGVEWTTKAILGQVDIDKEWDAFVKQCYDYGMERFVDLHNIAHDRFLAGMSN